MIERSLVLVKPDGVKRALIGEVIKRFEQRGLRIAGMKLIHIDKEFAKKHYTEDIAKKHGEKIRNLLLNYVTEGPVVAMCVEGVEAIEVVRKIAGVTYPNEASIGTIRGDFGHVSRDYANKKGIDVRNVVHASGSKEEAEFEVGLWFNKSELFDYKTSHHDEIF